MAGDSRNEGVTADADLRDDSARTSPSTRKCADCGETVADDLRYCPSCGRFVPGGTRPFDIIAKTAGAAFLLPLIFLIVAGYIWVPVVGFLAEAVLWGYVFLTGGLSISVNRILVGTGIGLVLLAVIAVVLWACGVGG